MAGSISLSADTHWSASSWLFDWILRSLAHDVESEKLARALLEIVDENLGRLDLSQFTLAERDALAKSIHALPEIAQRELPQSLPQRQATLDHIGTLVEIIANG